MATTTKATSHNATPDSANELIDSLQDVEKHSLEAVRKFVDSVNDAFPDLSADDGPRRKIIDSAFKMAEQLVGASNDLARGIVKATENVMADADRQRAATKN